MGYKKRYLIIIISIIVIIFFAPLAYKNINVVSNIPISIPKPEKIIIYSNNKSIVINEKNKNFNKVLELTSERLKLSKNMVISSDKESNNQEVSKIKYAWKSIELIYTQPATLKIKANNNIEQNITLKNMTFLITSETPADFGSNMFYGEEQYNSEIKNINTDTKIMNKLLQIIEQEI